MKILPDKKDLLIGILVNTDYAPSVMASTFIQKILKGAGLKTITLSLDNVIENKINCSTIFNVYYGDIGDGGIISGIFERNKVAFVGNSQYSCSLMLNKIISKMIFKKYNYLTPPFWYEPNAIKTEQELVKEIGNMLQYPILAKPVNGAASENICLIDEGKQLQDFISRNRILIDCGYYFFEKFIMGKELSAGYVNSINDVLPVIEIHLTGDKYQSNKVKFSQGLKENIIPASIDSSVYKEAQMIAKNLNSIFECKAFSRTDMIYDEPNNRLYVLEINTNPGLLEKSLLPLMVKKAGIDYTEFFLKLIYYSMNI